MHVIAYGLSDIGLERDSNEDTFVLDDDLKLYAVCDGMGGQAAGEVASERAIHFAVQYLRRRKSVLRNAHKTPDGYFRVLQLAEEALEDTSQRLYELASTEPHYAGMGTTLTMLLIVGDKGIMSHVGDCRLYLLRDRRAHLLSSDHTLANELVEMGNLSEEEAAESRYQHVLTRSIGQQAAVQVESLLFDLFPEDIFLLCSDGLCTCLQSPEEIGGLLQTDELEEVPRALIDLANSRGGTDNTTAIVIRIAPDPGEKRSGSERLNGCLNALKTVFLFSELSLTRLTRVLNIASIVDYAKGERVISPGDDCEGLYVVLEGRFSMVTQLGAKELLAPGHCFGETALLFEHSASWSVAAERPSRMMFIRGRDFEKLTRRFPKLGRILLNRLGQRLSETVVRLAEQAGSDDDTVVWP